MDNFVHQGRSLTIAFPYPVTAGGGVKVGNGFGIGVNTHGANENGDMRVVGVFDLAKDGSSFADGDVVYWDDTAHLATASSAGNMQIGVVELLNPDGSSTSGALTEDATVRVRLNGAFPAAQEAIDSSIAATATVALSAAQLIAMGTVPVSILAAPGAGKAILVKEILFEMTRTGTAFTGGGAINFQYHTTTGSIPHSGAIPASLVTSGGAGTAQTALGQNTGSNGLVIPANEGIDITNATAAFATGTGTAKVLIKYRIVTL